MAKNLVEVEEEKKPAKKSIDLKKIKNVIDDHPEAVRKIKEGVKDILASEVLGNAVKGKTKKSTTKKTTSKKSAGKDSDGLSKVFDLAGSFLKK